MKNISTDPALLKALYAAAKQPMNAAQLRQQRIDYIVGSLSDEGTTVTQAEVAKELDKFVGAAA